MNATGCCVRVAFRERPLCCVAIQTRKLGVSRARSTWAKRSASRGATGSGRWVTSTRRPRLVRRRTEPSTRETSPRRSWSLPAWRGGLLATRSKRSSGGTADQPSPRCSRAAGRLRRAAWMARASRSTPCSSASGARRARARAIVPAPQPKSRMRAPRFGRGSCSSASSSSRVPASRRPWANRPGSETSWSAPPGASSSSGSSHSASVPRNGPAPSASQPLQTRQCRFVSRVWRSSSQSWSGLSAERIPSSLAP